MQWIKFNIKMNHFAKNNIAFIILHLLWWTYLRLLEGLNTNTIHYRRVCQMDWSNLLYVLKKCSYFHASKHFVVWRARCRTSNMHKCLSLKVSAGWLHLFSLFHCYCWQIQWNQARIKSFVLSQVTSNAMFLLRYKPTHHYVPYLNMQKVPGFFLKKIMVFILGIYTS